MIALVTGAGRGIGRAIARRLAEEGYDIALHIRKISKESEALREEIFSLGRKAELFEADLSYDEDVIRLAKEVEAFGEVKVIVNNAGITRDQLLIRMKVEDFEEVLNTNLTGAFRVVKAFSRGMLKRREGSIINISSVVGLHGNVGQCNYAASKAGLIGLTKALAREWASRGIRVNALAPGYIETEMTRALSEELREEILKNIPLQRMGLPCDVAELAAFLATDRSNYITGQVIQIDGGLFL